MRCSTCSAFHNGTLPANCSVCNKRWLIAEPPHAQPLNGAESLHACGAVWRITRRPEQGTVTGVRVSSGCRIGVPQRMPLARRGHG
jgi:hypothetical protein